MPWIQIKINTTNAVADALSDQLETLGALSVTFQGTDTCAPILEPSSNDTRLWEETIVIALFDADANLDNIRTALKQSQFLTENTHYQIEHLQDKVWEREWMEHFHPMRFGQRLWICPGWCEAPEPNAVNIKLDPGLAFGTGSHPTTALCLEWLDSLDLSNKIVIDFGCGSGILAIAALKLGARHAIGIDIDPQAIYATRENAQRNQVHDRLSLFMPDDLPTDLCADLVIANILAEPLCHLAPKISDFVYPKGLLCLSGILSHQAKWVSEHYTPEFILDTVVEQEQWCRITGVRR